MHRTRAIQMHCAPSERQGHDEVHHTQITDEMRIEWPRVLDVCREVCVPREWEEEHPRAVDETYDGRENVEESQHEFREDFPFAICHLSFFISEFKFEVQLS